MKLLVCWSAGGRTNYTSVDEAELEDLLESLAADGYQVHGVRRDKSYKPERYMDDQVDRMAEVYTAEDYPLE